MRKSYKELTVGSTGTVIVSTYSPISDGSRLSKTDYVEVINFKDKNVHERYELVSRLVTICGKVWVRPSTAGGHARLFIGRDDVIKPEVTVEIKQQNLKIKYN